MSWSTALGRRSIAALAIVSGGLLPCLGASASATTTTDSSFSAHPRVNTAAFAGQGDLAFVSSGELYVLDGTSRTYHRVTEGSSVPSGPAFSHDGRWLAFVRSPLNSNGSGTLWIARGNGTDAHQVTKLPPIYGVPNSGAPDFSWNPLTDQLLVTTGPVAGAPLVPRELWVVSANGRAKRILGPGDITGDTWSPNGQEVAVIWTGHSLANQVIETLSPAGGTPMTWLTTEDNTYYLAGWASGFGILVWYDEGNGGPSVENDGLPLGSLAQPGGKLTVLATAPLFQPPALATGPSSELAIVANGNPSGGDGDGEKFVWFGKTVETCSPTSKDCSAVEDRPSLVTLNPAISPVNGSLAFVEAPQSTEGIVPYSSNQSSSQIDDWDAAHSLWILPMGSVTPTEISEADGASDPLWSTRGMGLLFVKNQAVWLMANPGAVPIEVASPLDPPMDSSGAGALFGYVDWPDQFAWSG
jgi:Tol biopolymer transport system component